MQTTIENWNLALFGWINVGEAPPAVLVNIALFAADTLIFVLAAWMVVYWVRGSVAARTGLIFASVSAGFGLGVNQIIGLFWYHPRPFEMGVGQTLMPHVIESSFPSDHGVIFFSIGLALWWVSATRRWGVLITALGMLVAWSRVYLGVHFPFDMLGSFVVALAVVALLHWAIPFIGSGLEPFLSRLYGSIVKALRLPRRWFPVR